MTRTQYLLVKLAEDPRYIHNSPHVGAAGRAGSRTPYLYGLRNWLSDVKKQPLETIAAPHGVLDMSFDDAKKLSKGAIEDIGVAAKGMAQKASKNFTLRGALRSAHSAAKRGKAGAVGALSKLLGYAL